MNLLILVVDDEPDVAPLFRQQFRRELRSGRFAMRFAQSAEEALERLASPEDASLILVFSDINMPGMSGFDLLPRIRARLPGRAGDHGHGLRRCGHAPPGAGVRRVGADGEADRLRGAAPGDRPARGRGGSAR